MAGYQHKGPMLNECYGLRGVQEETKVPKVPNPKKKKGGKT